MVNEKNGLTWWIWLAISGVLVFFTILIVWYALPRPGGSPEIVLSALLIIGVIALIAALSFTALIFKSLGLANTTHALGLPEGSIRAVIALSLILIFIMSSIFLYWQVGRTEEFISKGMSQKQIDGMPQDEIVQIVMVGIGPNNETLYDVTRMVEKDNVASTDIAKQIITTVSTLVVAIAGFYFGTQAVAAAKGAVEVTGAPVINGVEPKKGKLDEEIKGFKIFGKNLGLVKEVKLLCPPADPIPCTDVTPTQEMVTCNLKIPGSAVIGKWTVMAINSDKGEARLENAFETEEKTPSTT